jgi:glycosyltransferase involved in cell wall biosynthesis
MTPSQYQGVPRRPETRSLEPRVTAGELSQEVTQIARQSGIQAAYNRLLRAEVALGLRKPCLAIYDQAFHVIGGAQRYGLTMVAALRDLFDVTILANKDIRLGEFQDWYGLDLSRCRIKVIKLPYYEERNAFHIDPAFITRDVVNPFHLVSRESGNYDVFVNGSMNEMVYPLSNISLLICHFPERRPKSYFYADRYAFTICNSRYGAEWVEKKWKFSPQGYFYPPVDMEAEGEELPKKKYVLSVARFEPEGTKRQREMIEVFSKLTRDWPDIVRGWKFILAGGSLPNNRYLSELDNLIAQQAATNIELRVNIPIAELKSLYQEATLFWHLCGLTQRDPSEVEHFGMTTAEAMQNGTVPIVYDGGGLRETVDHGVNGFRVRSRAELIEYSVRLFLDQGLVKELGQAARVRARTFSRANFETRVKTFFAEILESYRRPA